MKFTKNFKELSKNDADIAGGKGASLGEMTNAGIPVPPGFVVLASSFDRFCEETDLNVEIDAILHKVNHQEIHTVERASEEIQALILAQDMPKDIGGEIESDFKKLGAKYVAVRSSATAEDSSSAAWAGQLDSFLNTEEFDLLKNVKRCWASLFTPRAIFYRFEKDLHKTKISVAVVVQKMVESEVSGIAFSVHPVTEDYNQMIIEAGFGLGEAIVSGQITPDSYVVEKEPRNIIDINISEQDKGLYRLDGGGNQWRDISQEKRSNQKLSGKQIMELFEIILTIEKHYGFPCDIEWAFENSKFYIVQSRPITTLSGKTSSQNKDYWVENFSAECGYHLISQFINSGMWQFQKTIFGKNNPMILADCFIDCKGLYVAGHYKEKQLVEMIDKLMKLIYEKTDFFFKNHDESYKLNDKSFDVSKIALKKDLSGATNKELSNIYLDVLTTYEDAHQHSLGTTWYVDSYGGTFAESLLEKTKALISINNSKLNPAEVFTALTTSEKLSFGQREEIESLKILEKVVSDEKTKQIFGNLKDYTKIPDGLPRDLNKLILDHYEKWCWVPFGYLGPAYGVDYYLSVWAGLVRENIDVKKEIQKGVDRSKEIKAKKEDLVKKLDISTDLQKVYELAADITFLKGYRKDATYFAFFVLDKLFHEISKRLGISLRSCHMLLHNEIDDLLNGRSNVDKVEIERREQHAVVFYENENMQILSGTKADDFMKDKLVKKEDVVVGADTFKGTCACSGDAKGVVKIINKTEEMGKMNRGDIMIAHTTFPALVPAMKKASAIVTEDGGITCHAAIVARELKIPCVTGIKTITKVVKDGDEIQVDANSGVVRILNK